MTAPRMERYNLKLPMSLKWTPSLRNAIPDAIPEALMPPEKDPFGIVTEMFEVVIDLDYTSSTLLVTEVAPFTSTYDLTNVAIRIMAAGEEREGSVAPRIPK